MATIFDNLQNDRQYLAATGLDKDSFERLHQVFEKHYVAKPFNQIAQKAPVLTDSKEALFFILFYYKAYPTLEVLGLSFGFSNTSAFVYLDYVKPYLKKALEAESAPVRRVFESQADFDEALRGVEDIFVDGSEIGIQRAKNRLGQKADFSGKKNAPADSAADL